MEQCDEPNELSERHKLDLDLQEVLSMLMRLVPLVALAIDSVVFDND